MPANFNAFLSKMMGRGNYDPIETPIPYDHDPDLISTYSHKDYSGFFFKKHPRQKEIVDAFESILYNQATNYIRFIECLIRQALPDNKKLFLYWVKDRMKRSSKVHNSMRFGFWYSIHKKEVTSNTLSHVSELLSILNKEDRSLIVPFPWIKSDASVRRLVEIGLLILHGENIKAKSQDAFVIWLGQRFGVDVSRSFNNTRTRIMEFRLEEFESYKFAKAMVDKRSK